MAAGIGALDICVIVVLSGIVVAKSVWVSWRMGRSEAGVSPEEFFLAGRRMPFWAVGLSLFASNIGTEHFVGQAGSGAATGMPVAVYEWSAGALLFFLGFGLAPMYLRERLTTTPQWFERRYGPRCRLLFASVSLVFYVLTKIAASLFAGAVLLEVVIGIPMWASVPVILATTAVYTAFGGLGAVMMTDVIQSIVFVLGGFVGMCYVLSVIGGVGGMMQALEANELTYMMTTVRPIGAAEFPWTGMFIAMPVASVWYWCVDQVMVQRVFSAKSLPHAQAGCALAGYLKILPPFFMVLPGIVARCFFEECHRTAGERFPDWCETNLSDALEANKAYPLLIIKTFPAGLRGIMIVSTILAMMSSLDSVFNCISTVFTTDIYVRFWNPDASPQKQVWVGRLVTCIAAACGMAWLPMLASNSDGLYMATQSVGTHLCPTLVTVFLLGLYWPRANGYGAMAGMLGGFAFGTMRFLVSSAADCAGDRASFACMDFNHMALFIFALSFALTVAGSLAGERLAGAKAAAPPRAQPEAADPELLQMLRLSGVLLLASVLALCVGFGYAAEPSRGHGVSVSGGVLAFAAVAALALAANLAMCLRRLKARGADAAPEAAKILGGGAECEAMGEAMGDVVGEAEDAPEAAKVFVDAAPRDVEEAPEAARCDAGGADGDTPLGLEDVALDLPAAPGEAAAPAPRRSRAPPPRCLVICGVPAVR